MTIQEIKNNVALKLGYVGWHEIIDDHKLSDEIVDLLLTEQLNKPVVSVKRPCPYCQATMDILAAGVCSGEDKTT